MNAKRKGNKGETELARRLCEYGYPSHRNNQNYVGGKDNPDVTLPGMHVECKRVETLRMADALEQARQFSNVTEINGIILTKLDGTAKGGIAVAIEAELSVPVKYIGVGEKVEDMERFDPDQYISALFEGFSIPSDVERIVDSDIEAAEPDDNLFDVDGMKGDN